MRFKSRSRYEAVLLWLNLTAMAYFSLIALAVSFYFVDAPKREMTDADWKQFALRNFAEILKFLLPICAKSLIFNVVLFGSSTNVIDALKNLCGSTFGMIDYRFGQRDKASLQSWMANAFILSVLFTIVIISVVALGSLLLYRAKPPYSD